jgi:nucleoid-associated protein YgaU
LISVVFGTLLAIAPVFSEGTRETVATTEATSITPFADVAATSTTQNNQYFTESIRYFTLAKQSFDDGDYDQSSRYAEEAVRYAQLSDEYVMRQLKIKQTDDAMAAAKSRLDWATSAGAASSYPQSYQKAQALWTDATVERGAENWDNAIASANQVLVALSEIKDSVGSVRLPSQYTVQYWETTRDCLWNIAGLPWVFGDPLKWQVLYEANKALLLSPDNPDLIEPGTVLIIPSIRGEIREGMWTDGVRYPDFE